ncbi:DUF6671 family protein [Streptomyces sp. NPDC058766]|uniref:DUF6671 family protein n=1 Tax=Streptomyces sp. NPDC058766 TaxID=3346630 RepID=UPI003696E174
MNTHGAHPYHGVKAAMATRHGKEQVVAPALATAVGIDLVLAKDVDTDQLGTFTGEIPRRLGTPVETAVRKAELALESTGLTCAVASEGSFGPHPMAPWLACGQEHLVFLDTERALRVTEQKTTETNFAHHTTSGLDQTTEAFLDSIGFGPHAVIVRPHTPADDTPTQPLYKGIQDRTRLRQTITECAAASACGRARLETDMRAHVNPTRMHQIGLLAGTLAARLATLCPACAAPGYGIVGRERGLPCKLCGTPTDWHRVVLYGCVLCPQHSTHPRADGLTHTDPAHCPSCNP